MFDAHMDAVYLLDENGNILDANKAAEKALIRTREEILSLTIKDIDPGYDKQIFKRFCEENSNNQSRLFKSTHVRSDGTTFPVEVTEIFFKDQGQQRIYGFAGNLTDNRRGPDGTICGTDKRTEEVLLENEKRLRIAAKASYDVIYEWTIADGRLEWFGDIDGLLGYEEGEISRDIGAWLNLIHPEDRQMLEKAVEVHQTQTEHIRYEYRIRHRTGIYRHIQNHGLPLMDREGRPYKWIGACTDITERRKTEKTLQESEEKYRKLVNTSPYGIQLTDPDGKILFSNPAHHRIHGYPDGELVGKYIWDLMADERRKSKARDYYQKIIKNRPAPEVYFSRDRNRNGKEIDVRINWDYVYDSKGDIEGIISIITDITDQKILEARLRQAQKMEAIGTLAGGIAHDFNNILFPIIGHTEMLMEDAGEDSPLREGLNEIYAGALRAGDLVGQILTFSRQGETELKRMKLQPIINEALKLLRATLPSTISLRKNLQTDCGAVMADPTQIHQIVMNLATNAYHAMEEQGGDMNVRLEEIELKEPDLMNPDMIPRKYACLSVSDTGKGIDNPIINKIFDPFFTTKKKGKGTGMGLSVVHGIVNTMKGGIRVDSTPGRGTAFHIYLPVIRSFPGDLGPITAEPAALGTEKILLVDDDESILAMEKMILERLGYQVTSFSRSIEALEAFRSNPEIYDLVITDMTMPKLTGDKLAVEMLKMQPDIPILICTGFSETLTEEKIEAIGIKGILMKPIVIKKLAEKLRHILDGKK